MAYSPVSHGCGPHWTDEEFKYNLETMYKKYKRKWELFHILWTKNVGKEDYSKDEWLELESLLINPSDKFMYDK